MMIKKWLTSGILGATVFISPLSFANPGPWQQHGHPQMNYPHDFNNNRMIGRFFAPRHHHHMRRGYRNQRYPFYMRDNWYR